MYKVLKAGEKQALMEFPRIVEFPILHRNLIPNVIRKLMKFSLIVIFLGAAFHAQKS